jgi:MoaA/NifB/PqqE/SkfB family radical SAM enzyme
MLSTNLAMKRFDAEVYARSGLDFMTISVDGVTQKVYERFRKRGNIDIVFHNIQRLVDARRKEGRRNPMLNWQFLAFEQNAHEIEQARELAESLGVDQLTVARPFDVGWDDPTIHPAALRTVIHRFNTASDRGMLENWNPFPSEINAEAFEGAFEVSWLNRFQPQLQSAVRAKSRCSYLYKNMVMDANGRVLPCCAAPQPDVDLNFSIFDEGAADPFNAEKYKLARLSFTDKASYRIERAKSLLTKDPHCLKCDWYANQATAQIDGAQIRTYLEATPRSVFDDRSKDILSSW